MPLNQYTSNDLVTAIQDLTFTAPNARDWDPTKIMRLLNRSLSNYLVPFIVAADEEFYVTFKDIPVISGQQQYQLPSGCHGGNMRIMQLLDNQGQPTRILPQKELDVALNPYTVFGVTAGLGTPSGFYIEGNFFFPQPVANSPGVQFFRLHYAQRPSQLVLAYDTLGQYSEAFEVVLATTPNTSTGVFTVTNYLAGSVSGGAAGNMSPSSPFVGSGTIIYTCDVIQAIPPYDIVGQVNITNNQVAGSPNTTLSMTLNTVSQATDPRWIVGQPYWLAITNTSPVVTFTNPELSFGLMTQWAVCKVLEGKGDDMGYGIALKSLQSEEERAKEMLRRRVRGPGKRAFANPYSGKGGRGIVAFYT